MIKALLSALARFVEGDLPSISEIERQVSYDSSLVISPDAPIRNSGLGNETKMWGNQVSMLYGWTKKGEDQAETVEVGLRRGRGVLTATFVNDRLVELDVNGRKVAKSRFPGCRPYLRNILRRARQVSETS